MVTTQGQRILFEALCDRLEKLLMTFYSHKDIESKRLNILNSA